MIEMDRFVTTLEGLRNEIIERESAESAATMYNYATDDR